MFFGCRLVLVFVFVGGVGVGTFFCLFVSWCRRREWGEGRGGVEYVVGDGAFDVD